MAFNINEIKSQLALGGARPSLFQVTLTNPVNAAADLKFPFMCRAAQMPASTLGTIEVPYFGRKVKIAGDRTFAEWTVTLIQDEDMIIRNSMEQWSNSINSHLGNLRSFATASPTLYKANASVTHFGKTEVSPIDLDWNTTDTLEEFTVTFQYDYWEVAGITGNAGGT